MEKQYANFKYPASYLKVIELNLVDYENWYLMNVQQIQVRRKGLLERYPNRNLIPFAKRDDNDDIACFEIGHGERVFIVHDFANEGWERRQEFETFWNWFISAIKELIGIQ
ncbi:MAG: hypothetical protein BGN88_02400 [Clostridiales bacterium 43-6]|nr:MAG: hypothetical protein BGN88_02400 [Clostridiales bacterium 43-6]